MQQCCILKKQVEMLEGDRLGIETKKVAVMQM